MKILQVHFKNINSLAGEWTIDFTDRSMRKGILLFTGATGAGKTSILDAITLALYGRTAREDNISNSHNEIMTRGEGNCFAEVKFEADVVTDNVPATRTYAVRREQRRARNKSAGVLQDAQVLFTDISAGKDIQGHKKEIEEAIKKAIGLNFEQFTRTILLAQGQFDRFLKSEDKARAEILEQATGTEIYGRVGAEIFSRKSKAQNDAAFAEVELHGIKQVSQDELDTMMNSAASLKNEISKIVDTIFRLKAEETWLKKKQALEDDKAELECESRTLDLDAARLEPRLKRLETALKAVTFKPDFERVKAAERAADAANTARANLANDLTVAQNRYISAENDCVKAEQSSTAAAEKLKISIPKITKVREAKNETVNKEKNLASIKQMLEHLQAGVNTREKEKKSIEEIIASTTTILEIMTKLRDNPKSIVSYTNDQLSQQGVKQVVNEINASEKLRNAKAAAEKSGIRLELIGTTLIAAQKEFETNITAYDTAVDNAEIALENANKIKSLTERLRDLKDGEACPLCGATSHPYSLHTPVTNCEKEALDAARRAKKAFTDRFDKIRQEHNAAILTHNTALKNEEAAARVAEPLRSEADTAFGQQTTKLRESEKRRGEICVELKKAETELAVQRECANAAERDVAYARASFAALGIPDPDELERKMRADAEKAKDAFMIAKERKIAALTHQNGLQKSFVTSEQNTFAARNLLQRETMDFLNKLAASEFGSQSEWLEACWTPDDIEAARIEEQEFNGRKQSIKDRLAKNDEEIKQHNVLAVCTSNLQDVIDKITEAEKKRDCMNMQLGELVKTIEQANENNTAIAEKMLKLVNLREVADRWTHLDAWLGGSDGFRFRRYAQMITLRKLLHITNPFIDKMTEGRYQLTCNCEENMSDNRLLNVFVSDNDQGGTIRPTSNLSGGETFLVSLALALGLSRMTSGKLRIDTMFMDEGFGSLDSRTLEIALDTLSEIQESGKLIGIISHVAEVGERISNQIIVDKIGAGRSVIRERDGVSKVQMCRTV